MTSSLEMYIKFWGGDYPTSWVPFHERVVEKAISDFYGFGLLCQANYYARRCWRLRMSIPRPSFGMFDLDKVPAIICRVLEVPPRSVLREVFILSNYDEFNGYRTLKYSWGDYDLRDGTDEEFMEFLDCDAE